MFGYAANPISSYQKVEKDVAVESANPHQLILLLFDGALQAIALARVHIENGNLAEKGLAISKAVDLINNGLKASLDVEAGGNLASNLSSLYDYMTARLLFANTRKDVATLEEVSGLLNELRSAWAQIAPKNSGS